MRTAVLPAGAARRGYAKDTAHFRSFCGRFLPAAVGVRLIGSNRQRATGIGVKLAQSKEARICRLDRQTGSPDGIRACRALPSACMPYNAHPRS